MIKRCARCILPQTFPNVHFNEHGLCQFCQDTAPVEQLQAERKKLQESIAAALISHKNSHANYDCIVAYSGGKDSTFTLKLLVEEYGLRCLAITIDNGFVAEQAVKNCKAVTAALGVDHIMFTPAPDFMNKLYTKSVTEDIHPKSAIKRASRMCNSCINLINTYMLKAALQHQVKLIAGGYIGGQVPKDAAIMEIDLNLHGKLREQTLQRYTSHLGQEALKYLGLNADTGKVTVVNPMLGVHLSEEQIIAQIASLGWVMTQNTGKNSSNCLLNDLGIAVHYKQYGFNPYQLEISEQVRHGLLEPEAALKKVEAIPAFADVAWQAKKIGLNVAAL
jgi:tRNA(Ile)-lysidine synthase TilS/MesJ